MYFWTGIFPTNEFFSTILEIIYKNKKSVRGDDYFKVVHCQVYNAIHLNTSKHLMNRVLYL